ncbi:MAG: BlaR1 family beta-lactam sensor/signal transducer [Enterococcus sp.]
MAYFLLNLASFNLILLLLYLVRKLLNSQLSPLYQGKYWQLTALGGLLLIPSRQLSGLRELIYYRMQEVVPARKLSDGIRLDNVQGLIGDSSAGWLNDNALPVNDFLKNLSLILLILWIVGIIFFFVRSLRAFVPFQRLIREADLVEEERIYLELERAKKKLGLSGKSTVILQSEMLNSPATAGVFQPRIILPRSFVEGASAEQVYFILLHELVHQRNKDALQNYFLMGIAILNWFNPVSWLILKQARKDREISCDQSVMQALDDEDIFHYGVTLLDCAAKNENSYLLGFSGKRNELKRRIELISSFQPLATKRLAIKFALISMLIAGLFMLVPQARTAEQDKISNQIAKIEQRSDPLFDKNENNSLVIYDETGEHYLTYNQVGAHKRYSPDSTYKIWSAMFALDEKKLDRDNTLRSWDGTKYPIADWNQDQDLKQALTNSTNWYFQQLDSELGKTRLKEKFHSINYGNMNLLGRIDNYWLESSLKISPFEQVELYRKLFNGELYFSSEDTALVKASLRLQSQSNVSLYGKTGTGNSIFGSTGWFLGSIETTKGNYYFACHLQGEGATGTIAAQKTLEILKELEIY